MTSDGGKRDDEAPARSPGQARAPAADPAEVARWRAAESRLYPLVMSDPDLYGLAIGLVVEAREVLRAQCPTVASLAGIGSQAVLDACPSEPAVRGQGFDPTIAFDAARALRFRELAGG